MALRPLWILPTFLYSFLIFYTVGKTPWTSDQPRRKAATYTQDSTNTEQTHTDIHASNEILSHDPSVRANEDISCLRSRGHCDRSTFSLEIKNYSNIKKYF
jgi:hypothetical protein